VNPITVVPPGLNTLRQTRIDAVSDGHVRAQVTVLVPRSISLEAGPLLVLVRVGGKWGWSIRGEQRKNYSDDGANHKQWSAQMFPISHNE
jgi:hypothetical protein